MDKVFENYVCEGQMSIFDYAPELPKCEERRYERNRPAGLVPFGEAGSVLRTRRKDIHETEKSSGQRA